MSAIINTSAQATGVPFVRLRLKNFETGRIIEDRVRAGSDIDVINTRLLGPISLQSGHNIVYFMDNETFDQIELPEEAVADRMQWGAENENVTLPTMDDGTVLDVELPTFVTLHVVTAEVAVRGDTSTNLLKNVTVRQAQLCKYRPLSKKGTGFRIDTRSGEYVERAKE
ncbi:MAG: elongation factor P [Caldilineaceae bacterium]